MTVDETCPVLVVGAGPAGLSTAVFLAIHGVPPLVVERKPATSTGVKATGQYPHTMEGLRIAGVAERIATLSRKDRTEFEMVLARRLAGPVLRSLVSGRELGMRHLSPEEWGTASQAGTEAALADRATQLGVPLRFGTRLVLLKMDEDGVTAVTENVVTGARHTVRTGYVVAADGWRSPIREGLGLTLRGRGVVGRVLRVLFKADLSEPLAHTRGAADGSRFAAFHIGRAVLFNTEAPDMFGYFRNLTPELPEGWHRSPDSLILQIVTDLGLDPGTPMEIVETSETSIACGVAERFHHGRVVLAGDAAHVMPPTGGLGGNTAIMDGLYLGWRLAAVVRGWASPSLVDTYDAERRPYAELLVEQQYANLVERLAPELDDGTVPALLPPTALAFGYRYPAGAIIAAPDEDGALVEDPAQPSGRPGSHAPYVPLVAADGRPTSTTALFGTSFVLLTGREGAGWTGPAERAAARLGVPLVARTIGDPGGLRELGGLRDLGGLGGVGGLGDPDGRFEAAYGIGPGGTSLVRPDRFVAWRTPDPDDQPGERIEAVLRTLLGR